MTNLSYIDTKNSIAKGRLSYKQGRLDKTERIVDTITWSILCSALMFYPTLAYFHVNINSSNDRTVAFVFFPLIFLFGLYGLYRKLVENNLMSINTSCPKQKGKEYLHEFLKQKGYEVYKENKDIVIVNVEESLSFNNLWTKTTTFIVDDNKIYFAMTKNYPKLNPPVFFSHWFLKTDLRKYFKDKSKVLV